MADKGIWTISFNGLPHNIARVAIFGLHSGFVRARPRSVLLMIIHGDVVVTCTNAYFNRCSPTAHIGASRSSTLANSYGPVVEW